MPFSIRRLSDEELRTAFPVQHTFNLSEYVEAMRGLRAGEGAEVQLEGQSSRTVKRRVGMAAKRLGLAISWARSTNGTSMVLRVKSGPGTQRRHRRTRVEIEADEAASSAGRSQTPAPSFGNEPAPEPAPEPSTDAAVPPGPRRRVRKPATASA